MEDVKPQDITRRTALKVAGVGAVGALMLETVSSNTSAQAAAPFYKGADISWAQQMEAHGYYWNNANGVRQDLLTILKGYGINAIRLRTFVNPSSDPANGHCSIDETAAMAARCQNAGMAIDIDLMFGDTWNSVGVQNPPAAWANMTYSQMLTAMSNYVSHAMNVLKSNGVTPTWVQIGNEINSGICHPVGSVSKPAQMTGLLMAAYHQVKQVFPSALVIIHLAQPQKFASIQTFFNAYTSNGGQWDITGLSSYASGDNIPVVLANMKTIQSSYGKPVMQVEVGGQVSKPADTRSKIATFIRGLLGFGGLGVFYWEPEGYAPFTYYDMVAWDSNTRRPTEALMGFMDVPTSTPTPGVTPTPQPSGSYYKLVNRNSGKVLDVSGKSTADGGEVIQWSDNGGTNQQWQLVPVGSYYKLVNRNSGKVLDVSGGSTADGGQVIQWSDNGGTNQQWSLVAV